MRAGLLVFLLFGFVACHNEPPPKFDPGQDAPNTSCDKSNACRVWGWCGQNGNECVAVSDEGCRASRACHVSGLCSFKDGKCIAKSSSDCEGSQFCKENGLCSEDEGVCK